MKEGRKEERKGREGKRREGKLREDVEEGRKKGGRNGMIVSRTKTKNKTTFNGLASSHFI